MKNLNVLLRRPHLPITLFLATGDSYRTIAGSFRVGTSTRWRHHGQLCLW
uniref:Uncharacterized protein n=1 Tax=Knipowitschia caucasica TaxID=637954 RepID=A0AAV2JPJ3_KNICA